MFVAFFSLYKCISRSNLEELLLNSTYTDAARKYGSIFRDQPISPLEKAVYNVEYVMRHGELEHLKPRIGHLSILQLYLIDVWFVCGATVLLGSFVIRDLLTRCK